MTFKIKQCLIVPGGTSIISSRVLRVIAACVAACPAGAEFFPLKSNKDVRIHAIWASNSHLTTGHYINIGLTWKFNLTQAGKAIFSKITNK